MQIIVFLLLLVGCFSHHLFSGKKLNILYVVHSFPTYGSNIINPLEGLIQAGHKVTIYSRKPPLEGLEQYEIFLKEKKLVFLMENAIFNKNENNELLFLKSIDFSLFDVIMCSMGYLARSFLLLKQKKLLKIPIFVFYRGCDLTRNLEQKKKQIKKLDTFVDLYLPVCNYFGKILLHCGINPKKIHVLHSPIDLDVFVYKPYPHSSKCSNRITLITVARIIEKKGIRYAIEAVANLIKKKIDIEYLIVGDGPLMPSLQDLVRQLHVEQKVKFLGYKDAKEVVSLLHKSDLFLHPSCQAKDGDSDGIPRSIKEAMACGVFSIVSDYSGISELVVPNISGYVVRQKNVIDIEKAIKKFLRLRDRDRNKMTLCAFNIIKKAHSKEIFNHQLNNLLEKYFFS